MEHMTDATVEIDPTLFTVIIQFEVDAGVGATFANELTEAVGRTVVTFPGFRTAVFQLSGDGTRVINYAQWESGEIYDRSMSSIDPNDNPVVQVITRHGARVVHSDSYTVAATFSTGVSSEGAS